jgi:tetrapyrrole methylase family protein/MazG family protein
VPACIVAVGLGPAGPDLVTAGTRELIAAAVADRRCVLRTSRHPAASIAPGAPSFDHVYEAAATLEAVYRQIADELVAAAVRTARPLVYAVPGSPVVAEHTVELLVADADRRDDLIVEVVPALSFLDLAWARLGVDPIARSVRVVDGQRFDVDAAGERGPLLVAQCDSVHVLSDVKLALDGGLDPCLGPDEPVVVLQRLGLADEVVVEVPWTEIDRIEPDHLTSLYLPRLAAPVASEVQRFVELVATLRRECPWDAEQTHESLRRHLLEESYEVLEAIDGLDVEGGTGFDHLEEELGDLLFQVVYHATLATEEGRFSLADVATTVHDKLRARHPHVFGDVEVADADAVMANWEQLKKVEKGRDSVFDGIPAALPALLFALKVQKKAATLGLDQGDPLDQRDGSVGSDGPGGSGGPEDDLGAALFEVVDRARRAGVDPEDALRAAALAYRDRMRALELAGEGGGPSASPGRA